MKKIYTINEAYSGNSEFNVYEDGKLVDSFIDNDYNMDCHMKTLESKGYVHGVFQKELEEAENAVKEAQEYLDILKKYPVVGSEN